MLRPTGTPNVCFAQTQTGPTRRPEVTTACGEFRLPGRLRSTLAAGLTRHRPSITCTACQERTRPPVNHHPVCLHVGSTDGPDDHVHAHTACGMLVELPHTQRSALAVGLTSHRPDVSCLACLDRS